MDRGQIRQRHFSSIDKAHDGRGCVRFGAAAQEHGVGSSSGAGWSSVGKIGGFFGPRTPPKGSSSGTIDVADGERVPRLVGDVVEEGLHGLLEEVVLRLGWAECESGGTH